MREYWTLAPESFGHRFHFRNGEYLEAEDAVDGWIRSRVITGFRVRPEWLDPTRLPQVADCLAEMASGDCSGPHIFAYLPRIAASACGSERWS